MPNEIDTIGSFAFSNCKSLTDFSLPSATTIIGTGCFYNCSNLTSLPLPENVTIVNDSTFYGCSSLTSITLPNSVTSIGGSAFRDCSSLSSVNIGNSVAGIGSEAFRDCSSLANIYCYTTTPPMCKTNTFDGVSKHCYIHVPAGTIRDYQLATGWSDFFYYYEIEEVEQAIQTTEQENKPSRKIIRDGQVLILRNGVAYDMMGQRM